MGKNLYIAEKPSVAREFANALKINIQKKDGYLEGEDTIITWCVGHLVTMSYPQAYDPALKKWSMTTLPFIPQKFQYEVIPSAAKQFQIVKRLLTDPSVTCIYVCTDSGREGEYIYRLVDQLAQVQNKEKRRVWIDSQTEEEIIRGIREAKQLCEYDALSESAYLRAKEDYLMGINFSRLLSLKYGDTLAKYLNQPYVVISVGRVMTCVLGMVVKREREIRDFSKTPFYRVIAKGMLNQNLIDAEWKVNEKSVYFQSPLLYKENGFLKRKEAESFIQSLENQPFYVRSMEKKKENKNPPLLYNLAELQNECARLFKISPDETLAVVQELYEKKMVTYPRTDARVLSTAVSKEIDKNLKGLEVLSGVKDFISEILTKERYKNLAKTRYVDDKQITDHYAIIPTGQGMSAFRHLSPTARNIYELIVRRFLAIFYPPAIYQKVTLTLSCQSKENIYVEIFVSSFKVLLDPGYLSLMDYSFQKKSQEVELPDEEEDKPGNEQLVEELSKLKKGDSIPIEKLYIKEGETSPPKRYNSGSLILAMENAGQLIEDEELRATIKGSGIGTSATRAEILKKLVHNKYLSLNKKTQIVTPDLLGEMIFDVVDVSIRPLLNPDLTASWEKGLTLVAEGKITGVDYMQKLNDFVVRRTEYVKKGTNQQQLVYHFKNYSSLYHKPSSTRIKKTTKK